MANLVLKSCIDLQSFLKFQIIMILTHTYVIIKLRRKARFQNVIIFFLNDSYKNVRTHI